MIKELLYQQKRIQYQITGSGKPVFLVHGFGEDGTVWKQQVSFLENKFQLIIPHLPGTTPSELIADMTMEGMAEVIHAIIHEEDIDTCTVIGHSMGGYITLALAEKYPNHLNGFGLFHSSAFADTQEKKEVRQKAIAFVRQNGAFEFLKTAIPNLFAPSTKELRPGIIEVLVDAAHNFSSETIVSYYEAMILRPDRTTILKNTSVPVLFIMGKYDVAVPLEDGLKQCHHPEKSYIHILQNSGHMGMLEETEASNRFLEEFLLDI